MQYNTKYGIIKWYIEGVQKMVQEMGIIKWNYKRVQVNGALIVDDGTRNGTLKW